MTTPRYFVRAEATAKSAERRAGDSSGIVRIQDLFRLGTRGEADREWVVGADLDGNLDLVAVEDRGALAGEVQAHLSYHEIAIGGRVRRIAAEQLFLFEVQLVEQPADTPGLNVPVYLYGRLSGPFPRPRGAELPVCDGQLTVTRADVLAGLSEGEPHAFQYPGAPRAGPAGSGFHLLLPGGRVEEIEAGQSVVLAYPAFDPELAAVDAANEALTVQILYDLLRGFQEDLERAGKALPCRVPVPSRAAYVAQLVADGWSVKGDRAIRMPKPRNFVGAVVGRLFRRETMTLAPIGKTEDFFAAARLALQSLDGWPDARSRALLARLSPAGPAAPRAAALAPAAAPPSSPRPLPPRAQRPRRDDWMKDFIEAHATPGKAAPRITSSASRAKPAANADWRSDFAAGPGKPPDELPKARPEWMEDFEGSPRPQSTRRKR